LIQPSTISMMKILAKAKFESRQLLCLGMLDANDQGMGCVFAPLSFGNLSRRASNFVYSEKDPTKAVLVGVKLSLCHSQLSLLRDTGLYKDLILPPVTSSSFSLPASSSTFVLLSWPTLVHFLNLHILFDTIQNHEVHNFNHCHAGCHSIGNSNSRCG